MRRAPHTIRTAAGLLLRDHGRHLRGGLLVTGNLWHARDGGKRLNEVREVRGHFVVVGPCVFGEVGEGFSGCEEEDVGGGVAGEEIETLRLCGVSFFLVEVEEVGMWTGWRCL